MPRLKANHNSLNIALIAILIFLPTAQAQTHSAANPIESLRQLLACPMPEQTTKVGQITIVKSTTKQFRGTRQLFNVTAKLLTKTSDIESGTEEADEETALFGAPFTSLDSVGGTGNAAIVWCAKKEYCILNRSRHRRFPLPNCMDLLCESVFVKEHYFNMLTLRLCDHETAEQARRAIQELIQLNSAQK